MLNSYFPLLIMEKSLYMVFRMKININVNVVPLWVRKMNFNIFNQLWKKKDVAINGQDSGEF